MRPSRRTGRQKRKATVLTVTSLVDILSILLIFLLLSFSPEGALLHAAQDLELPESTSNERVMETDRVIAVTANGVSVGPKMVATFENWKGELLIPGLAQELGDVVGTDESSRRVLIQGDRLVPFDMLYAVLFTSHQAGYSNLALAAYERSDRPGGIQQ